MELFSNDFMSNLKTEIINICEKTFDQMMGQKDMQCRYLSPKGVSQYVDGVNRDTLKTWVSEGLKEIKIGGKVKYDKKDIDEFLERRKI